MMSLTMTLLAPWAAMHDRTEAKSFHIKGGRHT